VLYRKMFRIAAILLLVAPLSATAANAPRTYGKTGTVTNTNSAFTTSFGPRTMWMCNEGSVDFYMDMSDGVATTADASTNLLIKAGRCYNWSFDNKNPSETLTIGMITAASTTTYSFGAITW
jgi:hypothetical protein